MLPRHSVVAAYSALEVVQEERTAARVSRGQSERGNDNATPSRLSCLAHRRGKPARAACYGTAAGLSRFVRRTVPCSFCVGVLVGLNSAACNIATAARVLVRLCRVYYALYLKQNGEQGMKNPLIYSGLEGNAGSKGPIRRPGYFAEDGVRLDVAHPLENLPGSMYLAVFDVYILCPVYVCTYVCMYRFALCCTHTYTHTHTHTLCVSSGSIKRATPRPWCVFFL